MASPSLVLAAYAVSSTLAVANGPDLVPALAAPEIVEAEPSPLVVSLVSAGLAGVVLGVGVVAWWEKGFDAFHFRDSGFLGEDTYAGGADKIGHAYSAYVSMAIMTPIYRALGVTRDNAVWGASIFTFLLFNGFEVIDGFTDYGVEYGDILMNTAGIGLGLLTELSPEFDSLFGFRLGYVPSRDFLARDRSLLKFINDYNGMLYYVDLELKGVLQLMGEDPGWLRYGLVGVVWGTNNYSPIHRHGLEERLFGVHVGLSLSELLRAFGDGDAGVEGIATFFDYYAVPFLSVILMNELNDGRWILSFGVSNRAQLDL